MRMQRLINLVCVLADTRKMTVQEIADHFQVSKRTVFRDLNTLSHMGISVESCPVLGEGVSPAKEKAYTINKKNVSKEEALNMFTALKKPEEEKDHCPCKRGCRYHGSCQECVAVHRARRKNVPECMQSLLDGKINGGGH